MIVVNHKKAIENNVFDSLIPSGHVSTLAAKACADSCFLVAVEAFSFPPRLSSLT